MVECVVCATKRPPGAFHIMDCCKQMYCRECIGDQAIEELKSTILLNKVAIKCPTSSCKKQLSLDYLQKLKLPNWDQIDKLLLTKYFSEHNDIKMCPKQGCGYALASSNRCCYTCGICKTRWSDMISSKKHPAVEELGNAATYIEKMALGEQCPNCGVYIFKNGGCPHMVCNLCKFEFCWFCLQEYKGYKHTSGICGIRMFSLIFFYAMFWLSIFSKTSSMPKVKDALLYVGTGIYDFAISAFYVLTHGFWICWYENWMRRYRYNRESRLLIFTSMILVMYELVLNYIWYKYHLYIILYNVVKIAILVIENFFLLMVTDNMRSRRGVPTLPDIITMAIPSFTMFVLLFFGPEILANQMILLMPVMILALVSYDRNNRVRCPYLVLRWVSYILGIIAIYYFRNTRQIIVGIAFTFSHLRLSRVNA